MGSERCQLLLNLDPLCIAAVARLHAAVDQARHDADIAKREQAVKAAEDRAAELLAKANSDAIKTAELKATYEKRLAKFREAADVT